MPDTDVARSLIGQTFSRSFTIERGLVDAETRTVPLSFSSETPVERWYGFEILDHSPGAADLTRLNSQCPVLVCHDRYDQIGVVVPGSGAIGKDRTGRAVCLFSQSERGREIQTDVNDGIRGNTSFRYMVHEMVLESSKDGDDTYRVTKWEPMEVSFENIPADLSVGAGRSTEFEILRGLTPEEKRAALLKVAEREGFKLILDNEARTNQNQNTPPTEPAERTSQTMPAETIQPDANANAANPARTADQIRRDEIIDIGELAGQRDFAVDLALANMSVEEARIAIRAKRQESQRGNSPAPESAEDIAARNGHVEVVSRVSLRNFKGAKAQENAHRSGQFILGYVFDNKRAQRWCNDHGIRTHSEADNESGGVLVIPEIENVIIDLREEFGTFRKYANVVPMKSDKLTRPRRTGGLIAYPIGAKGASRRLTESKKNWDAVTLEAKNWGVLAKYEDELSEDASIAIADDLTGEAAYAFTITEDECGWLGDGTSEYHHITGVIPKLTGLSGTVGHIAGLVVATGTGADKWAEITKNDTLKLMGRLPKYAYKRGAVWHCSNAFWSEVLLRIITDAGGATMHEMEGAHRPLYQGYPVEVSQILPPTPAVSQVPLLFGNIASGVMMGDRRGVTMKQTDSNEDDFVHGLQCLKATERFDIVPHDVGNADSTAASRKPGPIVGLITKAS
jgi:HK97 family phage major capsid protein